MVPTPRLRLAQPPVLAVVLRETKPVLRAAVMEARKYASLLRSNAKLVREEYKGVPYPPHEPLPIPVWRIYARPWLFVRAFRILREERADKRLARERHLREAELARQKYLAQLKQVLQDAGAPSEQLLGRNAPSPKELADMAKTLKGPALASFKQAMGMATEVANAPIIDSFFEEYERGKVQGAEMTAKFFQQGEELGPKELLARLSETLRDQTSSVGQVVSQARSAVAQGQGVDFAKEQAAKLQAQAKGSELGDKFASMAAQNSGVEFAKEQAAKLSGFLQESKGKMSNGASNGASNSADPRDSIKKE
jgi:hypothetical protein